MRPLFGLFALMLAAAPGAADGLRFFTMGAGPIGGGYYAAASAICEVIHAEHPGRLRCSPDPSPGSVYNATALRAGHLDFALVQSDIHREAVAGTGAFAAMGGSPVLRSVLSLYSEPLTLVAGPGTAITSVAELAGKRISIGARSSGTHVTVTRLLQTIGLEAGDFTAIRELPTGIALAQICSGALDAALIVVGHPNDGIANALSSCGATLVPITGPDVEDLVAQNPDYAFAAIAAGTYPGIDRSLRTYSVTATLMTRTDVAPDLVAAVAEAIVRNLPGLNRRAPVIPSVRGLGQAREGLYAPLHVGVEGTIASD